MSDIKGEMIIRSVSTDSEIPEGKKLIIIMGTALVDESFEDNALYKIEGQLMNGNLNINNNKPQKKPISKFDGWSANDLLEEYPWTSGKPESSRSIKFMEAGTKALGMIAQGYKKAPPEKVKEFLKVLPKQKATLPVLDVMRSVYDSIINTLKTKKEDK